MSNAVICDKCKKAMYSDSRSDKDAYASFTIDYCRNQSWMHLCKACYRQFCAEFMRDITPEDFDNEFGGIE